ncbi:MAG TPA: arylesterase [Methylococcaceae bacterium]|nr:arylesterase [Methylococcaceae bacterium]
MYKILLLIGFYLSINACSESPPTLSGLPENAVILAFGDSLTYGSGASDGDAYPRVLSNLIDREVINEGISGETSQSGAQRLPALLDEYRPDLLILIHGGNDMLRKIPVQETIDHLNSMIAEAQQRNIGVIMMGVPKPALFLLDSAEFYRTIAEQNGIPADLNTLPELLGSTEFKSDPVHLNPAGYKKLAEKIRDLLIKTGALAPA